MLIIYGGQGEKNQKLGEKKSMVHVYEIEFYDIFFLVLVLFLFFFLKLPAKNITWNSIRVIGITIYNTI